MTENSLRAYLKGILGTESELARSAEKLVEDVAEEYGRKDTPNYVFTRLVARNLDRTFRALYEEDFVISGLPRQMTLRSPVNIVDSVTKFYETRGIRLIGNDMQPTKDYEEVPQFEDGQDIVNVHLDLCNRLEDGPNTNELHISVSRLPKGD